LCRLVPVTQDTAVSLLREISWRRTKPLFMGRLYSKEREREREITQVGWKKKELFLIIILGLVIPKEPQTVVKVTKGNSRQAKGNTQLTRLHADEVCVNFQVCQSLVLRVLLPDKINFNITDCGADGVVMRRVLLGRWPSGSLSGRFGSTRLYSTVTCYQCPMYGPVLALTVTCLWVCCIKAHEDIIQVVADHFNPL